MRTYLITGGTGLIGQAIIDTLLAQQHQVFVLTRDKQKAQQLFTDRVTAVEHLEQIPPSQPINCFINLAGAGIVDKRWTSKQKAVLRTSRIDLTQQLVAWIAQRSQRPECLISGSAIGWYGDQGDEVLSERSDFQADFAHQLCEDWEQAALQAENYGIRVAIVRTGLVLSAQDGFLQKMRLPFKLGLGGPIGDGRHYMSWIHLHDIRDLFLYLVEHATADGVFNGTAPQPVTNAEFTQTLAQLLNRPAVLRVPATFLKLVLGEMSALLLTGQRVIPEKARSAGFQFAYTELTPALTSVLTIRK